MYQVHVSNLIDMQAEGNTWSTPTPLFAKKHGSQNAAQNEADNYVKSFDPTRTEADWDIANRWWSVRLDLSDDRFEMMRVTVEEV